MDVFVDKGGKETSWLWMISHDLFFYPLSPFLCTTRGRRFWLLMHICTDQRRSNPTCMPVSPSKPTYPHIHRLYYYYD